MLNNFGIIFLSILFEAFPFVILGALVSSLIEVFVTPGWVADHLPKNKLLGYLMAGLMGFIFPVCECAIVPIMRRLIKKGTPVGYAITFMLAVPIVNPVVLLSTHYAFNNLTAPVLRGIFGFVAAMIVGISFEDFQEKHLLKDSSKIITKPTMKLSKAPKLGKQSTEIKKHRTSIKETFFRVVRHTNSELYEVGRFLIMGAILSALMQVFIPRDILVQFGSHPLLSVLFMMIFAFVISLCSEADAFIANTFRYSFTSGSIIAFLIFGPMMDIKNMLMLMGAFNRKFVFRLMLTIFIVCFSLAAMLTAFFGGIWI